MASTLPESRRKLLRGVGAAAGSFLLGFVLVGIAVTDSIEVLSTVPVVATLVLCAFVYGVGGLYDIVALGIAKRGVGHLTTGAGIVLVLLAPYGESGRLFVVAGALALLISAGYTGALAADVLSATEEPAAELESEGETG